MLNEYVIDYNIDTHTYEDEFVLEMGIRLINSFIKDLDTIG